MTTDRAEQHRTEQTNALDKSDGQLKTAHTFTFLGTGAGCGVPAFFCECPACEEARRDPRARRGDCGVMIEGGKRLVIDTPPDIRHQFNREGVKAFDRLLYTHAHFDHIGGLGELEYMVQLVTKEALPTYGSALALEGIGREFHYMTYCLDEHVLEPFDNVEYDGVRYTALPVTHAPGTFGYLVETPKTKLFYASDTGPLPPETVEAVRGVDVLVLDATFWKRNWNPNDHHSVQETIEEGFALDAGTVYLTHLAMHYDEPVTLAELEAYVEQYDRRVKVALDGMRFAI
ncbi:MBL fold metallo-hydrolase [Raoultibacter timonensis]|uniref:MBL fold metallo-hydrolase n=1 Tax=Raoultibacter timonensis TaxID=1907662 RepID=UPI0026DB2B13|nr:MBL fold metallo-hydrolase [Raoultibacter timonensis]